MNASRYVVLFVILGILASAAFMSIFVSSERTRLDGESGYVEQATYVVRRFNATHTAARSRVSNAMSLVSSNTSYVIQSIIDNSSDGDSVFVESGNYTISKGLVIEDLDRFRLFTHGASFSWSGRGYCITTRTTGPWNNEGIVIQGFLIRGRKHNHGIEIEDSFGTILQDLNIANVDEGVRISDNNRWSEGTQLQNVRISDCLIGVTWDTDAGCDSSHINILYINLVRNGSRGIYVNNTRLNKSLWKGIMIWIHHTATVDVYGLFLEADVKHNQLEDAMIEDFAVESFALSPDNVYGVRVGTFDLFIRGIMFFGGASKYTTYVVRGGAGRLVTFEPNDSYRTQNSGTEFGLMDGSYIKHDLVEKPTCVILTPLNTTLGGLLQFRWNQLNSNSTHFQINVFWPNGTAVKNPVAASSWYAEYRP